MIRNTEKRMFLIRTINDAYKHMPQLLPELRRELLRHDIENDLYLTFKFARMQQKKILKEFREKGQI